MTKDFMLVIQNVVVHCVTWTEAKLVINVWKAVLVNTQSHDCECLAIEFQVTAIKHGAGARDGVAGALEDCGSPAMIGKY